MCVRASFATAARAALSVLLCAVAAPLVAQGPAVPPAGHVNGIVFDSLDHRPLSGALVQLVEEPPAHGAYAATTDSLGHFHVDSVRPGSYVAGFLHPLLDTLGIAAPYADVTVSDRAPAHLALAVPSGRQLSHAICGDVHVRKGMNSTADSIGMLVGHVHDGATGAPVASSAVTITWPALVFGAGGAHTETRTLRASTNADGWFAMCGLSSDEYQVHAERGPRATGLVDLEVHPHDVARVTLTLGASPEVADADTNARGGAIVSGTVKSRDGLAIESAQVVVDGAATTTTTDAHGAFTLRGLPDGTRMAEVRALGYSPVRVSIEPSRAEPLTVAIVMGKRVETLNAVTVFGKAPPAKRDVTGFADRQKKGFGKFITQSEIDEEHVVSVCDLLRRETGLVVQDEGMSACHVQIRGAVSGAAFAGEHAEPHPCEPTIYEDAIRFGGTTAEFTRTVPPNIIMGIEIYTAATQPAQFQGGCGSIVVWTRQGEGKRR